MQIRYLRYAETDTAYASACGEALYVTTVKGVQSAPSAPTLQSMTANSVTLVAGVGYEYSLDGVTWQSSNVFTGLDASTNYTFYQRKAENDWYVASAASTGLAVRTAAV